jgi:hypothetical protein
MKNINVVILFALLSVLSWYALADYVLGSYMALILLLFALQIFLNDLLDSYLTGKLKARYFALVFAPGTAVHEASHAISAKMLGCRIKKISFFNYDKKNDTLGYVEYVQSSDRFVGIRSAIISFAPLLGCGIFLVAILNYMTRRYPGLDSIGPEMIKVSSFNAIISTAAALTQRLFDQIRLVNLSDPATLLLLYLEYSFSLGTAPSPKDISEAFGSFFKYKREALVLFLLLASLVLIVEYAGRFGDYAEKISDYAVMGFKWVVLILMLSTIFLVVALPLSYVLTETLDIKGLKKIVPPLLFIAAYYLTREILHTSIEITLVSALLAYFASMLVLKHPDAFVK